MRQRSLLYVFTVSVFMLAGCTAGMESAWNNFTAYYNTYYNAQDYYNQAITTVRGQQPEVNSERPIRVYEIPSRAGISNFEKAIEKGAKILRDHDDSDLVDNALFLIGRSYYFLGQDFSAIEKFDELSQATESAEMRQKALFWKTRTMYEMRQYAEAVDMLNAELNSSEIDWDRDLKAKNQVMLAELYAAQENWTAAEEALIEAVDDLSNGRYQARAWFLLGQINERTGNLQQARLAYNNVPQFNPPYALIYAADRKRAEMARRDGDLETAQRIFTEMSRDDKNFDELSELRYEIAKTLQNQQKFNRAEKVFKTVLYDERQKPSTETQALTYYGLAEIYRDYHKNLPIAAAYFDTSSQRGKNKDKLPEFFNADELAEAYGSYTDLYQQAHLKDSLLWLSNLDQATFDSVITDLRQRKQKEAERLAEQQRQQDNTMITGTNPGNTETSGETTTETNFKNGFLNHKSPILVSQAKEEFYARWGRRPLVDNWRRLEGVNLALQQQDLSEDEIAELKPQSSDEIRVRLDLSAIPTDSASKANMRRELAKHYYELGNVFFITLNQPDSAEHYYSKVITNFSVFNVARQAEYSLSELYYVQGQTQEAREMAQDFVDRYPNNRFSERLNEKYNLGKDVVLTDSVEIKREAYRNIVLTTDSLNHFEEAELFQNYTEKYPKSDYAAKSLFTAANLYIKAGREDSLIEQNVAEWQRAEQEFQIERDTLRSLQDSAQVVLRDTTLAEETRSYWMSIQDSSVTPIHKRADFPYQGAAWDSAITVLTQIKNSYKKFGKINHVTILLEEIAIPQEIINERKAAEQARKDAEQRAIEEEQEATLQKDNEENAEAEQSRDENQEQEQEQQQQGAPPPKDAPIEPESADSAKTDTTGVSDPATSMKQDNN